MAFAVTTCDRKEGNESKLEASKGKAEEFLQSATSSLLPPLGEREDVIEVHFDLPKLDQKVIDSLKIPSKSTSDDNYHLCKNSDFDYRAELEEAESHMREWVELFLIEIEKIETFYCSKF